MHRDVYAGGRKDSCPSSMGAGGARIALDAELFRSFLSCSGVFSGVVV